jgi:GntR family transcriptional regulator
MQPSEPTQSSPPLHIRIADDLRRQIASGELGPGDVVPTLREISTAWSCAEGTARSAFAELRSQGLIVSERGHRTRVRAQPTRIRVTLASRQRQKDLVRADVSERIAMGASELTTGIPLAETNFSAHYQEMESDGNISDKLSIPRGSPVIKRVYTTTRKPDGQTILASESYIPRRLIETNPDLLDARNEPWPGGHQHQLYTVGIEVERFENLITVDEPTTAERAVWGILPGVPMLRVHSLSVDISNTPVEYSIAHYPGDRVEISYTEYLERWT